MTTLKLMTFNVRFDHDQDPFLWADRIEVLTKIVEKYTPDVIGFQEVKEMMYEDLKEKLGAAYASYGVLRSEDDGAEMSAIFVQKSRFTLNHPYTFWLSEIPEEPFSVGWDAALPRVASAVTVTSNEMDEDLFVMMNAHFDHEGVEARVKSAELIRNKMEGIQDKGLAVMLSGDFNFPPTDSAYDILTTPKWVSDSYSSMTDVERVNALTFHDFTGDTKGDPIDYIMVSAPYVITKTEIIRDVVDGVFPSDHYPVMVHIEKN